MRGEKIVVSVVDGLKAHPLALALVVVNVGFLIAVGYFLYLIGQSTLRKDALLTDIAKSCIVVPKQ
jgi:hypothetical protein